MDHQVHPSSRCVVENRLEIVEEVLPPPSSLNPWPNRIVKPEVAIGKEQNPDVRLLMHFQGKGSLRSWPGFAASSTMPHASRRGTVILT
ncbi:MAG: hypothetical protein QF473_07900 [Planctomycetota bacterium]|nr:hypothetical protein [Planctomycetota bacterium]